MKQIILISLFCTISAFGQQSYRGFKIGPLFKEKQTLRFNRESSKTGWSLSLYNDIHFYQPIKLGFALDALISDGILYHYFSTALKIKQNVSNTIEIKSGYSIGTGLANILFFIDQKEAIDFVNNVLIELIYKKRYLIEFNVLFSRDFLIRRELNSPMLFVRFGLVF